MPFPKGVSGNPGGRPKEEAELKRIIDEKCPPEWLVAKLLDFLQYAKNDRVKFMALQEILNRRYGKPKESVEVTGTLDIAYLVEEARKRVLGTRVLPEIVEERPLS